jgi:spermidine synthase
MKAVKVGMVDLDPGLVKLAKQYPDLWSGRIDP